MRYGTLFTGIGTADYGFALLGWQCVFQSEIVPYAARIANDRFGGVQLGDVETADFAQYAGLVDMLCGGFTCQNISIAGNGEGISGSRSGLWRHYHRAIEAIRPRYAIIENSDQLTSRGLDEVLCDLAQIGYDAEWECLSAAEFGADHERSRIYILAYPNTQRRTGILHLLKRICHANDGLPEHKAVHGAGNPMERFTKGYGESPVWGVYHGFTARFHIKPRIAAIGNAMYWPIPYMIGKTIEWAENCTEEEWLTANYQALQI